ncbi:MAG: hypothetical protein AAGB06_00665, partial [Verrucomicrobiota bacterium]
MSFLIRSLSLVLWIICLFGSIQVVLHAAIDPGREELDAKMESLKKQAEALRASGVSLPMQQLRQAEQRYQSAAARGEKRTMRAIVMRLESRLAELTPRPAKDSASASKESSGERFKEALEGFVNYQSGTPSDDADGYIGVGYTWNGLAKTFRDSGADYAKTVLVSWGKLEPRAPLKSEGPSYTWTRLDEIVKEYQNEGFELQMVLKSNNPWAIPATRTTDGFVAPGAGSISALPEPKHQV